MNIERELLSRSEEETEAFAAQLAHELPRGTVLALEGDLGAGKTVFSRGFARGLGITEPVSSPTYTIIQEYSLPGGGRLYHLDLYRIDNPDAALAFGIDEFLYAEDGISLIEWPERIHGLFPPHTVYVDIRRGESDGERVITVEQPG